jgi:alanine racemase
MTRIHTIKHYAPGTTISYGRRFTTERETRMGVLGIGYADGLPRLCSNNCSFAVAGGMAPQRGRICMDMCMVDLTELPDAERGDEVEIFGPRADLNALSRAAQTIPYELLCAVSKRVPRELKNF